MDLWSKSTSRGFGLFSGNSDSYVCIYGALNGVSQQPVLKMLELYPQLQRVTLCLDNDKSGRKAASRIHKTLQQQDYKDVVYDVSAHKDWNEDLKASCSQEQSESIMTMT